MSNGNEKQLWRTGTVASRLSTSVVIDRRLSPQYPSILRRALWHFRSAYDKSYLGDELGLVCIWQVLATQRESDLHLTTSLLCLLISRFRGLWHSFDGETVYTLPLVAFA